MRNRDLNITAIILKTMEISESDLLVTCFSKELGKFNAFIKGIRKIRSRMMGKIDIFREIACQIHNGSTAKRIVRIDSSQTPFRDANSSQNASKAYNLIELVNICTKDEHILPNVYELLRSGLNSISTTNSPSLITEAFKLKLFTFLGILAPCTHCGACNNKFSPNTPITHYIAYDGILICDSCLKEKQTITETIELDFPLIKLIYHLQNNSFDNIQHIEVNAAYIHKLKALTGSILFAYTEKGLKSEKIMSSELLP